VVNQNDPSFGEENLSHAAWARFRMTVRADGLNEFLTTNREQFKERRQVKIFRAFLRKVFNTARNEYDSDPAAGLTGGGDALVQSLGVLSLSPLRDVVAETLAGQAPVPGLFDDAGVKDKEEKKKDWLADTSDHIKNALNEVKYERLGDESFVKFRLSDNSIVVNKDHPFVEEHSKTKAEKELMRTVAMVNLLTDIYTLNIGVPAAKLQQIRDYRDKLMRYRALQSSQSGTYIAKLLLQTQHQSEHSKRLELVVSDALRYLGFQVRDLGKPGEPEGVASAYPTPTFSMPSDEQPEPPLYSFSFDAKASKHDAAKTGNIKLDGVVQHRDKHRANYALVVAPGYQEGSLAQRCAEQKVTPITARDLGRLLEYTVEHGAIPLPKLKEMFGLYDPNKVTEWVTQLKGWLTSQRSLTLDVFLKALQNLKGQVPDALAASTVALECRRGLKVAKVRDEDVIALARGLSILIPDLVAIDGTDKIIVNASADRVHAAVQTQLEKLHSDEPAEAEMGGAKK
jgi:hypothetical protein